MEQKNSDLPEEVTEKVTEKVETAPESPAENKEKNVEEKVCKAGKSRKTSPGKRITKWIFRSIAAILLLLVILITALFIFIDPIVKAAIVNIGPKVAGVNIELEDISVQIFKGRVEITNLTVGNPEGYSSEYALHLGDVAVETDILSWLKPGKKIIRDVRIKDVTINYETELPFENNCNLNDIVNHIKGVAGQPVDGSETTAFTRFTPAFFASICLSVIADAPATEATDGQKRFQLDKLVVENVRVVVIPKKFPDFNVPITITLPEMGPVGTNPEGLTGPELAAALAEQALTGIFTSVKNSSEEIYQNLSTQGLQLATDIINRTQQAVDNARQEAERAAAAVEDTADKIRQEAERAADVIEQTKEDVEAVTQRGKELWQNIRNGRDRQREE
ncbi:MAG: hypothetical protein E7053_03855 [Lentisphaerae bacterium]|nr:hypothetical protein [Lentisphaerota bacterium]